ncbi:type IV secretion system DNA-binding domain-containing protein [Candidatus Daviesbacteria bacterium]|nr:type IV secretion system DNA-binding domain-containing protein [Candidatus Daviesbacteria bacterium]
MHQKIILEIKTPRTGEETPEAMVQFLASLTSIKAKTAFSLEIVVVNQAIHFYIAAPLAYQTYIESQLLSQYPKALVTPVKDDGLQALLSEKKDIEAGQVKLQHNFLYPLKSFNDFKDVDPMSSLLGILTRIAKEDVVVVQFLLCPVNSKWQSKGQRMMESKGNKDETTPDTLMVSTYSKQISDKVAYPGFKTAIRILTKSSNPALMDLVAATFISFNNVTGNSLSLVRPFFWQHKGLIRAILLREISYIPRNQILNIMEIATIYHFPGTKIATIGNISWSKTILSDPPENLPVAYELTDDEKKGINFFARTEFKNKSSIFGIYQIDRRKHMYIIGKTGTGKSTLIANLAINDIRNNEGLAVIDPHGDLSEVLLDYIPSYRVNDIVYLNPADVDRPFHLNPLEVTNPAQKELIASGIVSIFYKLYGDSWGPRLEYILRNVILTLIAVPSSTLMMVPEILTNQKFRKKTVADLQDPVLVNYWTNEFEKMPDKLREESISPILNKVGQFLSSKVIRNIVAFPKSTVNLEDIMNNGKIAILNLSQGRIGEDNSALLGAMIITKLQLAAMNRVNTPEAERRDFYLYVDEFQNFATTSFIKILSEARKYHLNLILANQYTAQIDPLVRSAIFGNAGTIMSFIIGAEDTPIMAREFGERFKEEDLLSLGNYQLLLKMSINGLTSTPFFAQSLPLPQSKTQNREKAIRASRERYTKEHTGDKPIDMSKFAPEIKGRTYPDENDQRPGKQTEETKPGEGKITAPKINSKELFVKFLK